MKPEIVAPGGTPAALVAAIDAGADTVYCGFRDATNARNYPGLNFTREDLKEGPIEIPSDDAKSEDETFLVNG